MSPFSGGLATVAEVATAAEAGGVFTLTWLLVGLPLLIGTVLLIGALNFLPALALGPIVEHFLTAQGRLF